MRALEIWEELEEGWTGWAVYILLGIALAFLLKTGLGLLFSTELPVVTVRSGSMIPTLNRGNMVFVRNTGNYEVGDIIVFDGWLKTPIIHRVVGKYEDGEWTRDRRFSDAEFEDVQENWKGQIEGSEGAVFITEGDRNHACDQCIEKRPKRPVTEGKIYGERILSVPYLGWVKLSAVKVWKGALLLLNSAT